MRSITPPGHKSRRLDSHQHDSAYKADAFLFRATSAYKRSRPEGRERDQLYFSSSTFQYASLMNFDQLSIRTSRSA